MDITLIFRKTGRYWLNNVLFVVVLVMVAEPANAADLSGIFGGVTDTLKSVVKLLIYDWSYYIGIAALALQGYRWWASHITMMDFLNGRSALYSSSSHQGQPLNHNQLRYGVDKARRLAKVKKQISN